MDGPDPTFPSRAPLLAVCAVAVVLFSAVPAAAQSTTSSSRGAEQSGSTASESSGESSVETTPSGKGIDIDVQGGARRVLIPMAVPDTLEPAGDTKGVALRVQEILRNDFKLSGFFEVLPTDSFFFDPGDAGMDTGAMDFKNWFNVGAQALVKSAVRVEDGKVHLDLRLYAVDTGKRIDLGWNPGPVSRDVYEKRVHDFVNLVLEHYTGKPGVFGTKITFAKRDENGLKQIYIAQMDGSNRIQVTDNQSINMLPTWGKGHTVYFTSYRHHNPDLWRYRDGRVEKVSAHSGQNSGARRCGDKLALTMSAGGDNTDIYLIDPESGKIEKRLTDNWAIDSSPSWNPNCSKIAFVSGRSGSPQIYVMNADGTGVRRLTYKGSYNTSPDWSPEGDKIAFTARDKYNRFDIFLVNLDGDLTRLTQDQGNNEQPSFSPDGRYIIFTSDRGGKGNRLFLMTADGEVQNPITPEESGFSAPDWRK